MPSARWSSPTFTSRPRPPCSDYSPFAWPGAHPPSSPQCWGSGWRCGCRNRCWPGSWPSRAPSGQACAPRAASWQEVEGLAPCPWLLLLRWRWRHPAEGAAGVAPLSEAGPTRFLGRRRWGPMLGRRRFCRATILEGDVRYGCMRVCVCVCVVGCMGLYELATYHSSLFG